MGARQELEGCLPPGLLCPRMCGRIKRASWGYPGLTPKYESGVLSVAERAQSSLIGSSLTLARSECATGGRRPRYRRCCHRLSRRRRRRRMHNWWSPRDVVAFKHR
jgi:hypothetical protein